MPFGTTQATPGFGLNTNQGFGSGGYIAPSGGPSAAWQAQTDAANRDALSRQLGSQQSIATGHDTAATQQAEIAADASKFPSLVRQQEFGQLFPLISGIVGNGQGGFKQYAYPPSPAGPQINAAPVLNPQQIQQQVNQSRAQTDAGASSTERGNANSLAGRGFGSNSPLLAMLNTATQNSAAGTNAQNETGLRLGAAQANAGQVLNAQTQQANEFAAQQQQESNRFGSSLQHQSSILAALAGLI